MSYATNTDLAAEFKALGGFSTATNPTAAQVDEWCARNSALIDASLGGKYLVPITGASSLSLMKEICVWLTRPRIASILNLQTGDNKTSTSAGKDGDWTKKAMDVLKEIKSGSMKLTDAPLATSTDGVESYSNDNLTTVGPPKFTRENDGW